MNNERNMTNKDHISSVGQGSRLPSKEVLSAVDLIKTAILQSQERAVKAVNQEQLALYGKLCSHGDKATF